MKKNIFISLLKPGLDPAQTILRETQIMLVKQKIRRSMNQPFKVGTRSMPMSR
jgi:hypothetical protein